MTNNELSRRSILKGSLGLATGATVLMANTKALADELALPKLPAGNALSNASTGFNVI